MLCNSGARDDDVIVSCSDSFMYKSVVNVPTAKFNTNAICIENIIICVENITTVIVVYKIQAYAL